MLKLKLVFCKDTKRFASYKIGSDEGIVGNVYLPKGIDHAQLPFEVFGPDHPDQATELAKIENK